MSSVEEDTTHDLSMDHTQKESVSPTSSTQDIPSNTPDWLKEENSPFGSEDIFAENTAVASADIGQPDWLQDAPSHIDEKKETTVDVIEKREKQDDISSESEPSTTPLASHDVAEITHEEDIPDWLQGAPVIEETH